jgi:hypothetical protein
MKQIIMKYSILLAILMLPASCSMQRRVQKQANELAMAMQDKKYETTARLTHPKIIEMLGGKAKYIEILQTGHEEMNKIGYGYESIILDNPSAIVKAGKELHCIIPETITMRFSGGRVISKSALLGVSNDKGKTWTFIETGMLIENNLKTILPDYNPLLKIPEIGEPEIIYD